MLTNPYLPIPQSLLINSDLQLYSVRQYMLWRTLDRRGDHGRGVNPLTRWLFLFYSIVSIVGKKKLPFRGNRWSKKHGGQEWIKVFQGNMRIKHKDFKVMNFIWNAFSIDRWQSRWCSDRSWFSLQGRFPFPKCFKSRLCLGQNSFNVNENSKYLIFCPHYSSSSNLAN